MTTMRIILQKVMYHAQTPGAMSVDPVTTYYVLDRQSFVIHEFFSPVESIKKSCQLWHITKQDFLMDCF